MSIRKLQNCKRNPRSPDCSRRETAAADTLGDRPASAFRSQIRMSSFRSAAWDKFHVARIYRMPPRLSTPTTLDLDIRHGDLAMRVPTGSRQRPNGHQRKHHNRGSGRARRSLTSVERLRGQDRQGAPLGRGLTCRVEMPPSYSPVGPAACRISRRWRGTIQTVGRKRYRCRDGDALALKLMP